MSRIRIVAFVAVVSTGLLISQAVRKPIHAAGKMPAAAMPAWQAPATATPSVQRTDAATSPTLAKGAGEQSYDKRCAICHGEQREGILPGFPPLVGVEHRLSEPQIISLIRAGKGRMPGFPKVSDDELKGLVQFLSTPAILTASTPAGGQKGAELTGPAAAGNALFQQNCAFCHGRDAMGGETGPDLTQSKLVLEDKDGSAISAVVHQGRLEKKMPAFQFSNPELMTLVAFIRARVTAAESMKGGRRGVAVADLQTGNVDAGKKYFTGAGGCSKCHSATGDLAGIARRFQGLRLEERMLYPRDAKSTIEVTLPSGETLKGTLAYQDEFTVALKDKDGVYKSWSTDRIKFKVDSPVEAHVEQFPKYTDDDIHNLMAFLQTLK
jgi:mono/diheme cytochrome c family protein